MTKEFAKYWEFIKRTKRPALRRISEEYPEVEVDPEKIFKEVQRHFDECKKLREFFDLTYQYFVDKDYFNSIQYDYGYDELQQDLRSDINLHKDGPYILSCLYDLSEFDYTYIYLRNSLALILNKYLRHDLKTEEVDKLKLYKLIKTEPSLKFNQIVKHCYEKLINSFSLTNQQNFKYKQNSPDEPISISSNTSSESNLFKSETYKVNSNPEFKEEAVNKIFEILKLCFDKNDHEQLLKTINTGNLPSSKLLFKGSCKTLLDFFKQLMTGQFLSIPVQRDLEKWVCEGFNFLYRKKSQIIKREYASKIISGSERAAEGNRLIDCIKLNNGQFEIIQLEIKSRIQKKNNK